MNINKQDLCAIKKKYPDNYEKLLEIYPPQYLVGNVDFLNFLINVDKRVLIPRFETEYLVEKTIKLAKEKFQRKINIIDLGTGSGCIAIALQKLLDSTVTALDISQDALSVAKENAKKCDAKITFFCQNMIDPLPDAYDIIISNPPYIPENGYVEKIVLDNEPHLALFAKDDGLYFYKQIINNHFSRLTKGGFMAFEIGDNEREKLENFIKNKSYKYEFSKDLQGLDRYLFIFNE